MGEMRDDVSYSSVPSGEGRRKWYSKSYIVDYVVFVVLCIILACSQVIEPFDRYLPNGTANPAFVDYPLLPSIVPTWVMFGLAWLVPVIVFALWQIKLKNGHDFHNAVLGIFVAAAVVNLITEYMKIAAGRYRPDWLARCKPVDGACTGEASIVKDGRQSFPSGHSSNSFAGLLFLSLYMSAKLGVFKPNAEGSALLKGVAVLIPGFLASFIAVSRTVDYHHNFSDILAGTVIGIFVAFFSYFLYFPSLFCSNCDLPRYRTSSSRTSAPGALAGDSRPAQFDRDIERS